MINQRMADGLVPDARRSTQTADRQIVNATPSLALSASERNSGGLLYRNACLLELCLQLAGLKHFPHDVGAAHKRALHI